MPAILLYLLKVNVALLLFYLAYHLVLRRLTFYHLNRLFLVFGIVFSTVYPFIDLSELFAANQPIAQAYIVTIPAWALTTQTITQTPTFDYWLIPVYLFWAGVIVMLIRFIVQFVSLYKIHAASEPANYKHIDFRKATSISQAFSFWQTIYLNPAKHKTEELESILRHELIHITGWHTLDVLLAELSTVFYWFNPGAWLMKKAVKENLEFIADQNVVNTGVDKKEYQYLLLKVVGATQPQIANQFNFPSLKRRIAMMNKMPSTKKHLLTFLAVVPVAAVLLLAFDVVTPSRADNANANELNAYTRVGPDIYIRKAPTFKTACWFAPNTLTITTIAGDEESYQLDNEKDLAEANSKYGLYLPDHEKYNKISASTLKAIKQETPDTEVSYETFYARNPEVSRLAWLSDGRLMVQLKSGVNEVIRYGNKQDMALAEMRYGKLPSAPPVVIRDKVSPSDLQEPNLPEKLVALLKKNPAVKSVRGKVVDNRNAIVISLKGGGTEVYYLDSAESIVELERKYNLPELPPPPPPVPADEELPPPPPPVKEVNKLKFPEGLNYYLDGKADKLGNYKNINPDQIHSVNVYKGESAERILGKPAAKGLISIITKGNKDSRQVQEFQKKYAALIPPASASGQKGTTELIDNRLPAANTFSFILTPENIGQQLFNAGKAHFKQNGFDVDFKGVYSGTELTGVQIITKSSQNPAGTNSYYSIADLKERNYGVIVTGNKETGQVTDKAVKIP